MTGTMIKRKTWNAEDVVELERQWENNVPVIQIAKHFGVTKNAIIGKADRLNFGYHVGMRNIGGKAKRALYASKKIVRHRAPLNKVHERTYKALGPGGGKKIKDLDGKDCRWPIGDPQSDDFIFCGARVMDRDPYCEEHKQIAYR